MGAVVGHKRTEEGRRAVGLAAGADGGPATTATATTAAAAAVVVIANAMAVTVAATTVTATATATAATTMAATRAAAAAAAAAAGAATATTTEEGEGAAAKVAAAETKTKMKIHPPIDRRNEAGTTTTTILFTTPRVLYIDPAFPFAYLISLPTDWLTVHTTRVHVRVTCAPQVTAAALSRRASIP